MPLAVAAKAEKQLTPENTAMLGDLARDLAVVEPFDAARIHAALHTFADRHEMKLGKVAQPLRAALCGTTTSPGIDLTAQALGRDEVLARIGAVQNG